MNAVIEEAGRLAGWAYQWLPGRATEVERVVVREIEEMLPRAAATYVRLAGLSGAIAVGLGAYGAHVFRPSEADPNLKLVFETGNRYHFFHTLALMAVPLTRRPNLVGPMMFTGTLLFSGSCYLHALTGNTDIRKVTPYGGMLLIGAWLAIIF